MENNSKKTKKEPIIWNIKEQAEIAKKSYEERPDWIKQISHWVC